MVILTFGFMTLKEYMKAFHKMRKTAKEKELEALLTGEHDSCSCFIEVRIFLFTYSTILICIFALLSQPLFCSPVTLFTSIAILIHTVLFFSIQVSHRTHLETISFHNFCLCPRSIHLCSMFTTILEVLLPIMLSLSCNDAATIFLRHTPFSKET